MGSPDAGHVEHVARAFGRRAARTAEPAKTQLGSGSLQQHAGRPAALLAQKRERAAAGAGDEVSLRDDDRAATEAREHVRPVKLSVEPEQRIQIGREVERVSVTAREPRRLALDRPRQHPSGFGRRQPELLADPGREAVLRAPRREHSPERREIREHDGDFGTVRAARIHGARHVAIARQGMSRTLATLVHDEAYEIVAD